MSRMKIKAMLGAVAVAAPLWLVSSPAEAASGLQFQKVQFNLPGSDTPGRLNEEWVQIKNVTSTTKNLKGWKVYDRGRIHAYTFPTTPVAPGEVVRLHTGSGTNSTRHRYWGQDAYVWNDTGDTAYLYRPDGTRADRCEPPLGAGVKGC
jgi:hypothetical protein